MIQPLPHEAQEELFALLGHDWPMPGMPPEPAARRIAIAGLEGAGKRVLLNSIWGYDMLDTQERPRPVMDFGLFTIVDLPPDLGDGDSRFQHLTTADAVVYLLDGSTGLRREDFGWIARLRGTVPALIVAFNHKGHSANGSRSREDAGQRLGLPVIGIEAADKEAVHRAFLPALLRACPSVDVALGQQVSSLRSRVAWRHIVHSLTTSAATALGSSEAIATSSIQSSLVRKIAAVYGMRQSAEQPADTLVASALEIATRYVNQRFTGTAPGKDSLIRLAITLTTTLVVGQSAVALYGDQSAGWLHERLEKLRNALPGR